jgi:hypothetical protein
MTSLQSFPVRRLTLSLCALLSCLTLAIPTRAAQAPAGESAKPVEELMELDEVKVRGKIVANAVITVEDRLFRLYNKLNTDNRYDVHCRDVRIRDRLGLLRVCKPEFLAVYAPATFQPASINNWNWPYSEVYSCDGGRSGVDANGNMISMSTCQGGYYSNYSRTYTPFPGTYAPFPAPPVLVPAERIAEYKQNMLRVLNSDPELHAMATQLAGMYHEVDRIEARHAALQEEKRAIQKAKFLAARERARSRGREVWPPHPRAP